MLALSLILVPLLIGGCASAASNVDSVASQCYGDNSKPMYGYDENHALNSCDQAFIDDVSRQTGGHPEAGANSVRAIGYSALENDPSTAIKRFNQAWLLDRNDPETFRAFSAWETKMGNIEKADQFRDRARRLQKLY
ncbi:MAG: hypothetical protein EOP05_09145 [Proteobacteria bacterium]|nr:MAG: hypothetical protein EOP05_09145 [Pseudomonadota bacterium]